MTKINNNKNNSIKQKLSLFYHCKIYIDCDIEMLCCIVLRMMTISFFWSNEHHIDVADIAERQWYVSFACICFAFDCLLKTFYNKVVPQRGSTKIVWFRCRRYFWVGTQIYSTCTCGTFSSLHLTCIVFIADQFVCVFFFQWLSNDLYTTWILYWFSCFMLFATFTQLK